jgi:hypothetical protein
MKLSEQVKLLERENERLRNMIDNLTEQLQSADYFIDIANRKYGFENYTGANFDLAPDSTQEVVRAWRKLRPEKEATDGETP